MQVTHYVLKQREKEKGTRQHKKFQGSQCDYLINNQTKVFFNHNYGLGVLFES